MKKFIAYSLSVLFLTFGTVSCVIVRRDASAKTLPPGQAKKMSHSRSARAYAPGHNKH